MLPSVRAQKPVFECVSSLALTRKSLPLGAVRESIMGVDQAAACSGAALQYVQGMGFYTSPNAESTPMELTGTPSQTCENDGARAVSHHTIIQVNTIN